MSDQQQPRLKVPSIIFSDKTPTPTRLLKAVDEIGLFHEDEKVSSAKSTSSNNPFDVDFRKALYIKKEAGKSDQIDDVLNTPQILHDQSAPPSAAVLAPQVQRKFLPIAPSISRTEPILKEPKQPKKKKANINTDKDELKARNRAAASRSRNKKKLATAQLHKQVEYLTKQNKILTSENELLKKELAQIKSQIDIAKAPVIITLDQNLIRH